MAEDGYSSDSENSFSRRSVSPGRRRVPSLSLASVQRVRSQSTSSLPPMHIPITPIPSPRVSSLTLSPKQKWKKSHPEKKDAPLLIEVAEKAYRREASYEFETQAQSSEQTESGSTDSDEISEEDNHTIAALRQELERLLTSQKKFEAIIREIDDATLQYSDEKRDFNALLADQKTSQADKDQAMQESKELEDSLTILNNQRRRVLDNIAEIKKGREELQEQLSKLEE